MHLPIEITRSPFKSTALIAPGEKIHKRAGRGALLAEKQSPPRWKFITPNDRWKRFYRGSAVSVLVITISNAHLCPPGAPTLALDERLLVPLHRVVRLGSREVVGQVWALLFSLPVSVSHLLTPYRRCFSFQSGEIRLRVHVRVYSHSNQLRRLFFELKPSLLSRLSQPIYTGRALLSPLLF